MVDFGQGRLSPSAYVVGVFDVIRKEPILAEQLHCNLLFPWFVQLTM
jgi:hypothetical protein